MTRLRLLFTLLCLCWLPAASALAAAPTPAAPANGATWEIGTPLSFTANYAALDYTDQSRLKVRWSSSAATNASGVLASGTDLTYPSFAAGVGTFSTYSFNSPSSAGTYYWQPYADTSYYPSRPIEAGPISTLNVVTPPGPTSFDPAPGASIVTHSGATQFTVSGQSGVYSSATVRVSRSSALDARGRLGSDVLTGYMTKYSDGAFRYTTYSFQNFAGTPGTYYWQVELTNYSVTGYSGVQTLTVTPAVGANAQGGVTRSRIPRWVGVSGWGSYVVNDTFGIPDEVSGSYFRELARLSGWRWGMTYAGTTSRFAGGRDGTNAVAFSYLMPDGVLGLTSTWTRASTRKVRTCRRGKCRITRKRVNVIVEQDIQINGIVLWEEGPPYPLLNRFDLESVLVHEFGHMAAPTRNLHFVGCRNSPMVKSAGGGEYWRSETDWARRGCGAWAAERAPRFGPRKRLMDERVLDLSGRPVPGAEPIVRP
jgi:hypothetical protein